MGPSPPGVRVRKTRRVLSPRGLTGICRRKPRSEPSDVPETPLAFVFLAGLPRLSFSVWTPRRRQQSGAAGPRRQDGRGLSSLPEPGWPAAPKRSFAECAESSPEAALPALHSLGTEGSGHVPDWEVRGLRGFSDRGTRAPLTF